MHHKVWVRLSKNLISGNGLLPLCGAYSTAAAMVDFPDAYSWSSCALKTAIKKESCLDFNSCYLQNTWKGGRCGLVIHVSAASGALVWLTIEGLLYRKASKLLRKLVALGFASKTLAAWW